MRAYLEVNGENVLHDFVDGKDPRPVKPREERGTQGYLKVDGKFVLHNFVDGEEPKVVESDVDGDGEPDVVAIDEVAVAYCPDPFVIFTHGSKENVLAWTEAHNAGSSSAKALALVFHPDMTVEDVNQALHDPIAFRSYLP